MKSTYFGTDSKVGFISSWEINHKQVGHGEKPIDGNFEKGLNSLKDILEKK